MRRGEGYFCQKQYEQAIADFDKASQLNPAATVWRSYKARALFGLGKATEAGAEIEAGLKLASGRDRFLSARGEIASTQGNHAQAIADYTEAMKLAALKWPADYAGRAAAYEKSGQKAEALADYKAAIGAPASTPLQYAARTAARERLAAFEAEALAALQAAQAKLQAELGRRIALVIGAGAYENAPKLRSPANDTAALAAKLREQGFAEVTELRDPGRASLEAAIKAFGDKAGQADWAVIYYAALGCRWMGTIS